MSADILHVDVRLDRSGFRLELDERIELAGVTAVFGPSGSGKSTLLRVIAGFERPDRGRVARGEAVWFDAAAGTDVPAHGRPVGIMFQEARLFPHLTVAGNLRFAERRTRRALPGFERAAVVAALDLEPLLTRSVAGLSGGERKRVALGRTLLAAPGLLLLDEPLAGLDRARKAEIVPYLETLPQRFHIPTLYVSHDIDEVARLADRMLVLNEGHVQLHGSAAAVVEQLDLQPDVGRFEAGVLVSGRVLRHDARLHLTFVDVAGDELTLPMVERAPVGSSVRLRIRARDVAIAVGRPTGLSIRNVIAGTVTAVDADATPGFADVKVAMAGAHVRARITRAAVEDLDLRPGRAVFALIKSVSFERVAL